MRVAPKIYVRGFEPGIFERIFDLFIAFRFMRRDAMYGQWLGDDLFNRLRGI